MFFCIYEHDATTIMFDCRDGINEVMNSVSLPPYMALEIVAKFKLHFIRREDLASHGLILIQVPFGKLQVGFNVPFSEEWLLSDHSTIKA